MNNEVSIETRLARAFSEPIGSRERTFFDARLADLRKPVPERRGSFRLRSMRAVALGAALVAAIVLPFGVAAAQGWLPNVIPVFIRGPIDRIEGLVTQRVSLTNVGSDEELQRLLSFPLWVPTDVPCPGPNQRAYDPARRTAALVYQCVAVSERSADTVLRPVAMEGTLEEVVINGHPGYYYKTTAVEPGSGRAETASALVFEGAGTIVTLSPLPWHTRNGVEPPLGKEDLIRIAESMKQVGSR